MSQYVNKGTYNLKVKDPYEQCVQYDSIEAGIQAHAETYSFNIESELFNQLTKEQQKLWRKEIEQACISGGNAGVELAMDKRYNNAVIEKACRWIKENITNNPNANSVLVRNGCVTLGMLVKDFQNYMKGE